MTFKIIWLYYLTPYLYSINLINANKYKCLVYRFKLLVWRKENLNTVQEKELVLRCRILFWLRMKNVSIKQYPEDPSAEWISCSCWRGQMLLLLLQKCSDISATLCSIFWLYKSFSPLTFSIFRDVWFNKTWFIRDVSMFVPEPIGRFIRAGNETSRSLKLYNHGLPQTSRLEIGSMIQIS